MKTEYLEEFVALATMLNYAKVAKRFHLSTSALSKHISTLEGTLGQQLFNRTTTTVRLTAAGRRFYEGIFPIMDEYRSFMKEYLEARSGIHKRIDIIIEISTSQVMRAALQTANRLKRDHDIEVAYSETLSPLGAELDQADALISYRSSVMPKDTSSVVIARDPFVAVVPIGHPLAECSTISVVRDLPQYKVIRLRGKRFKAGEKALFEALSNYGVAPTATTSLAESFDDISLFAEMKDILILPLTAAPLLRLISSETHKIISFEEPLSFEMAIVFRRKKESESLRLFIDGIRCCLSGDE